MVTQKDIAERANVSVAMVSRVLSGKAQDIGASQATIDRIQSLSREMGYRPSYAAQRLKGAPSNLVGVAVVDFDDPFLSRVIQLLQSHAASRGFSLLLAGSEEAPFERFLDQSISRMILLGSLENLDWLNTWSEQSIPVMQLGAGPDHPDLHRICIDEVTGYLEMIRHVKETGVERIHYLGPKTGIRAARYRAFQTAMAQCGLPHSPHELIETRQMTLQAGAEAMERLFGETKAVIECVACANDRLAMGTLSTLGKQGIQVPNQVQIFGFDNIPMAAYTLPPLTTLEQPIDEMVQTLLDLQESSPPQTRAFPPRLQRRQTTR
jgi:DNA-binding LacI/PurR family transcriptional regulator